MRFLSLLERVGRRHETRAGPRGMIGAALGSWLAFFRPTRLLRLIGSCAVIFAVIYVIGFRSAESRAEREVGPGASAERLRAATLERLRLKSCSGLSRTSCWPPQGSYTLYVYFGSFGTAALLSLGGIACFLLAWGLSLRRRAG
jgi:uncharacterized membrane protein YfcA